MPVILAKYSRAEESLSLWFTYTVRDSFRARLAGFEFAKALQMRSWSAFAFETITLWHFEKKLHEANASVKQNTVNTFKQIISLNFAMKIAS